MIAAKMKTVIIFIGANGSGKSTLARRILTNEQLKAHIDPDAYGKKLYGMGVNTEQVAKETTLKILEFAASGIEFSFETVGSSSIKRELIGRLKEEFGYHLVFHYCYLGSDKESIEGVSQRVRNGGHDVPINRLIDRFPKMIMNVNYLKTIADEWHEWKK